MFVKRTVEFDERAAHNSLDKFDPGEGVECDAITKFKSEGRDRFCDSFSILLPNRLHIAYKLP